MQTASCPCGHRFSVKNLLSQRHGVPSYPLDLFLTMLLFWCGWQHELPSPLGIQIVYCHVCLLPGTRCCHGYLWIARGVLGKQVLCQGRTTPRTSCSSLMLVLSNFDDHPLTIFQGVLPIVFLLERNIKA